MPASPVVQGFHDSQTGTVSYVAWDPESRQAAVIDPVLDYDAKSGHTATRSMDRITHYVSQQQLTVAWILETHAHADHLSAAHRLQQSLGGRIGIGARICAVQSTFGNLFHLGADFSADGSQFDHLFEDAEAFSVGTIRATTLLVPGHTPADLAYHIGDDVFVGDTLFMPDAGTARADFPGGDARQLYRSIRRILELPPQTRIHVCHDYPPEGRAAAWTTTVAEQRARNIHVHDGIDEATFIAMREARDATLDAPALILPSLQVNIRAGRLPEPERNGTRYLKIPLDALPLRAPRESR